VARYIIAEGFAGIADVIARTARNYFVDNHTVVMILSDGYDAACGSGYFGASARLKRGAKVVWINPLKVWDD
jgi:uncharacterized protein with von Willebrand factor type A (vWA) domain